MTLQELINWCAANDVSLDTPIVLREKDDFLLVQENISTDENPYFGNCPNGDEYFDKIAPRNDDGEREKKVAFLVLGTGY